MAKNLSAQTVWIFFFCFLHFQWQFKVLQKVLILSQKVNSIRKLPISKVEIFPKSNFDIYQGFGREKDGNRGKSLGSNLVIFCYKEFEKFALCKSVSRLEFIFIVYSEPIESGHVKLIFHIGNTFKM